MVRACMCGCEHVYVRAYFDIDLNAAFYQSLSVLYIETNTRTALSVTVVAQQGHGNKVQTLEH